MTDTTARRLAHGLWLATALLFAGATVSFLLQEPAVAVLSLFIGLPIAGYGTVGALVARRRPQNPIGWLFCAIALSLAVWMFGQSYAAFGNAGSEGFGTMPGAAAAAWIGTLAPVAVLPMALPVFLLVFPDGRLRSRRWRAAVAAAVLGGVLAPLGMAATIDRYEGSLSLSVPGWVARIPSAKALLATGLFLAAGAAVAGLTSLAARFRDAAGDRRDQLRWLLWLLVAMAVPPFLVVPLDWFGLILMFLVDGFGILIGIPAATAFAVLTHGLYDVGVVVKKTIVYGLVVVFLTAFAALVIFFVSPLALGASDGEAAARIVSGLAFVALTVAATWGLTRRMARRIVYGKRATPYEAMSEFSDRLGEAYSTEDVLPRMAEIVRASTGADVARVWLHVGGVLRPAASSPGDARAQASVTLAGDELPDLPAMRPFPVRHRGELLGALTVAMPAAEPLSKTGEKLLTDLASQAGLVLRNVRLIEELQESRRRIVAAQDVRAKKLERDIHDGAQQQLVALSVKLRLAEQLAERDPEKAQAMVAELRTDANDALENLRDLARGIYPPLLADKGLAAALEAQASKSLVPITVDVDGCGRYPPEVEAAVYFCCLEALQNVAKYAEASAAGVRLEERDGNLTFAVADDGHGFDRAAVRASGLTNMRDRLEALGGSLDVTSSPGRGTSVTGTVPVGTSR